MTTNNDYKQLIKLAEAGNAEAEWKLGAQYDECVVDKKGKVIVKKNYRKAALWYRRSAEHNNSSGQLCYGHCLDTGRGVEQNKKEAIYWYRKAFNGGEGAAASNIAIIYKEFGNNRRAFFWFNRAVKKNDHDALLDLGIMYYSGVGVRKSYKRATAKLKEAINSQIITESTRRNAMYHLGMAFLEGKGVKKSVSKAISWFKEANYESDHLLASIALSKIIADAESDRK